MGGVAAKNAAGAIEAVFATWIVECQGRRVLKILVAGLFQVVGLVWLAGSGIAGR
jgi:hypothetical protein